MLVNSGIENRVICETVRSALAIGVTSNFVPPQGTSDGEADKAAGFISGPESEKMGGMGGPDDRSGRSAFAKQRVARVP